MLAAFYYNNKDVRIQELPIPTINDEEVLFKVMASGICGSDVIEWYRVPKAPRVLGHEATGIITQVGNKVKGVKIGDRVFVSHHVPCNQCRYCQRGNHTACHTLHTTNYYPGGFAQYIRVPKINVSFGIYKLPDTMSFEEGTFIEPLACVSRGQRLSNLKKDDTLLIIGSGISGILHVQLAKFKGVKTIVAADINQYRLELAKKFGAHHALDASASLPEKLKEITGGHLADQVIVCTGATSAALSAMNCVENGGTILFFAVPDPTVKLPIPINQFWRNEITMRTSYGAAPNDLEDSIKVLETGKINVKDMITHRLDIREAQEGFRLMTEAGQSLKVILEPNREKP
ncbi:MAG: zinc-dependent dehydrogenase [Candidatus Bathyarchaeota archaeon]|nr:zinc-dependent dehydrogenase [Candidatus Bathyarchaeota archaeon]MDI9576702.1 zinc-dependent dehydrogenase [Thermoproteota archaeon]MDT8782794.1 alcohol dehydrogenase catalytic domain-containing protein [Candidatus Bathyarchaeota archaeon]